MPSDVMDDKTAIKVMAGTIEIIAEVIGGALRPEL